MNFTSGLNINGRRGLTGSNTCSATHDNNSCTESPRSTAAAPIQSDQYTVGNGTPDDIAKYYTNAPPVHYTLHLDGTANDIANYKLGTTAPVFYDAVRIGLEGLERDVHRLDPFLLHQDIVEEIRKRNIQRLAFNELSTLDKTYPSGDLVDPTLQINNNTHYEEVVPLRGGNNTQTHQAAAPQQYNQVADNTNTIRLIGIINDRVEEKRILYNEAFVRRDYLAAARHQDGINMLEKEKSRLEAIINNNNKNASAAEVQQPKPANKRRSRKKKLVEVDLEAERQEVELRAKIKASLHSQHVRREVVEEEEAKSAATTTERRSDLQLQQLMNEQRMANEIRKRRPLTSKKSTYTYQNTKGYVDHIGSSLS